MNIIPRWDINEHDIHTTSDMISIPEVVLEQVGYQL